MAFFDGILTSVPQIQAISNTGCCMPYGTNSCVTTIEGNNNNFDCFHLDKKDVINPLILLCK